MKSLGITYARIAARSRRSAQRMRTAPRWGAVRDRFAATRGQGTVEYVGIVIVVAALLVAMKVGMAGAATDSITKAITKSVSTAAQNVLDGK